MYAFKATSIAERLTKMTPFCTEIRQSLHLLSIVLHFLPFWEIEWKDTVKFSKDGTGNKMK